MTILTTTPTPAGARIDTEVSTNWVRPVPYALSVALVLATLAAATAASDALTSIFAVMTALGLVVLGLFLRRLPVGRHERSVR